MINISLGKDNIAPSILSFQSEYIKPIHIMPQTINSSGISHANSRLLGDKQICFYIEVVDSCGRYNQSFNISDNRLSRTLFDYFISNRHFSREEGISVKNLEDSSVGISCYDGTPLNTLIGPVFKMIMAFEASLNKSSLMDQIGIVEEYVGIETLYSPTFKRNVFNMDLLHSAFPPGSTISGFRAYANGACMNSHYSRGISFE